jgi:hypothetical protein
MRLLSLLLLCGGLAACDDHDHDSYSNFQTCYDEHTTIESLTITEAIVVCCLDHEIDGVTLPCGSTAASCTAYLTNSVDGPTAPERETACDEYIRQKAM